MATAELQVGRNLTIDPCPVLLFYETFYRNSGYNVGTIISGWSPSGSCSACHSSGDRYWSMEL